MTGKFTLIRQLILAFKRWLGNTDEAKLHNNKRDEPCEHADPCDHGVFAI